MDIFMLAAMVADGGFETIRDLIEAVDEYEDAHDQLWMMVDNSKGIQVYEPEDIDGFDDKMLSKKIKDISATSNSKYGTVIAHIKI